MDSIGRPVRVTERIRTPTLSLISLAEIFLCLAGPAQAADKISMVGLFKDKAMVAIDGKQHLLAAGQTVNGVRLIAADSHSALIEYEGKRRTYGLGATIGTQYAAAVAGKTVQVWPDASGMYKVSGSVNGFPVQFLVDTGATLVAMSEQEAKRIGLPYATRGVAGKTSTASGVSKTYYLKAEKVRVGAIELRDVDVAVLPGNYPTEVLLGNSFLSRIAMARSGQLMELRTR